MEKGKLELALVMTNIRKAQINHETTAEQLWDTVKKHVEQYKAGEIEQINSKILAIINESEFNYTEATIELIEYSFSTLVDKVNELTATVKQQAEQIDNLTKQMPIWKKVSDEDGMRFTNDTIVLRRADYITISRDAYQNEYYIRTTELRSLPKDEQ